MVNNSHMVKTLVTVPLQNIHSFPNGSSHPQSTILIDLQTLFGKCIIMILAEGDAILINSVFRFIHVQ